MVSCCKLLDVRSFVFAVWPWSGNYVPVNLHQMNVILCLDKKGQGPILAKRWHSSAGSSFRARSPHPAQLSPRGSQAPNPTGPQSPQATPKPRGV